MYVMAVKDLFRRSKRYSGVRGLRIVSSCFKLVWKDAGGPCIFIGVRPRSAPSTRTSGRAKRMLSLMKSAKASRIATGISDKVS